MNAAERAEIERQLRVLRWADTPDLAKRLQSVHERMDAGHKVSQEELEAKVAAVRKSKA